MNTPAPLFATHLAAVFGRRLRRRLLAAFFLSFAAVAMVRAEVRSPAYWQPQFQALTAGLPRVEAEKEIERVRKVKATYELYAMDTAALAAYRLDEGTILLVTYKPGIPAAHVSSGSGGHAPVDGAVIGYQILPLR